MACRTVRAGPPQSGRQVHRAKGYVRDEATTHRGSVIWSEHSWNSDQARSRRAHIVNTAALAGLSPPYDASKHAVVAMSEGIHQCANVVTGPLGSGQAVLIRAVEPTEGIDAMRRRRVGRPDADLANGPGKLCQALGIGAHHDGADLLDGPVAIVDDGQPPPLVPRSGPRVGMTKGIETPWRFRVPAVSSQRLRRQ